MRHPTLAFAVLAGLSLAFAACSSPSSGCTTNADCPGSDTCSNGTCHPPVSHGSTGASGSSGSSSTSGSSTSKQSSSSSSSSSGSGSSSSSGTTTTSSATSSSSTAASSSSATSSSSSSTSSSSSSSSSGSSSSGSACATACNAPFTCDAASGLCKNQGVPQFTNVWIIVMENTSFSSLTASAAPYLNSLFTGSSPGGVELVRYQDTGVHPSLPNYLGLAGGDNFGISADGEASSSAYQVPASNQDIASQLEAAGLTWHEYSEAQLTPCALSDTGADATPPGYFASKHDPMPHFLITQNNSASCNANDVSYEPESGMPGIAADIAAGTYFSYAFIAPNLCDDGHDTTGCGGSSISDQDAWLSTNVPLILNSSAFKNNGFLFVTWDEGSSDSDAIMAVALSPMVASPGSQDNNNYTHYSLLSTIEAGFGLSSLPNSHGHNDPLITTIWK